MDMTKFGDEEDPGFQAVVGPLRRWIKEVRDANSRADLSHSGHDTFETPESV
jgi:hypothetical protein